MAWPAPDQGFLPLPIPRRRGLAAAVALAMLCAAWTTAGASELRDLREYSLELVNRERAEEGLPALAMEDTLIQSAEAHAADMLERDYFAHVSPEGEDVMDRFLAQGGSEWRLVTENIGHCLNCPPPPAESDIERQHEDWMQSPEHRANILREGLDSYGLGLAWEDGEFYAVQNFAGPGTPHGLAEDEEAEPLPPDELAGVAAERVNDHRDEQGLSPLEADAALMQAAGELVPEDLEDFALDEQIRLEALAPEVRGAWRQLVTIAGSCGGCGVEPTDADARHFVEMWLDEPQYRELLLDPDHAAMGFALAADGEGRKVALALLAGP